MSAHLCAHIHKDGTPCRAVALTGHRCCRAHRILRRRTRCIQRQFRVPAIRLGPLKDRRAIARALSRVFRALATGALHPKRAAALIEQARTASANLN